MILSQVQVLRIKKLLFKCSVIEILSIKYIFHKKYIFISLENINVHSGLKVPSPEVIYQI